MNSQELTERGDECFSRNEFNKALDYYTQAINTLPNTENIEDLLKEDQNLCKCFANRSKCNLEIKEYVDSMDDANTG